jgi:hypothetical protein
MCVCIDAAPTCSEAEPRAPRVDGVHIAIESSGHRRAVIVVCGGCGGRHVCHQSQQHDRYRWQRPLTTAARGPAATSHYDGLKCSEIRREVWGWVHGGSNYGKRHATARTQSRSWRRSGCRAPRTCPSKTPHCRFSPTCHARSSPTAPTPGVSRHGGSQLPTGPPSLQRPSDAAGASLRRPTHRTLGAVSDRPRPHRPSSSSSGRNMWAASRCDFEARSTRNVTVVCTRFAWTTLSAR